MHRTHITPRAVCRGLLTALALGLASTTAPAQEAKPQTPPPSLVVAIGGQQRLQMSKKQPIARAVNVNDVLIRVASVYGDPTTVLITGLEPGIAYVTLIDANNVEEKYQIVIQLDVEYLKSIIKKAVPTANVEPVPAANRNVLLTGTVARPEDADIIVRLAQSILGEGAAGPAPLPGAGGAAAAAPQPRVINALRVAGVHQVQVCVVVARVNRSEARQFGFSFLQTGNRHFLSSTVAGGGSLAGSIFPSVQTASSALSGVPNAIFGIINDNEGFVGFLTALRTEGVAKIMAEPRVTTLSGQPAYIVSGGETPILTATQNGVSVSYRQFGTVVNFLPIVTGNGRIYMQVRPEVSNRNAANDISVPTAFGTTVVPGFDTQSASVAVEMETGQTLAIGGLISHTTNGTATKLPVLGDLPYIGAAFSFKQFTDTEEELIILVTPHLVDPMSCDQLPKYLPGMETRNPDDFELFLEGILEAPRGSREVRHGRGYVPAFKHSPTTAQYPCADGSCNGNGAACSNGNCGPTSLAGTVNGTNVTHGTLLPASATAPALAPATPPAPAAVLEPPPAMPAPAEVPALPAKDEAPKAETPKLDLPKADTPPDLPPLPPGKAE